MDLDAIDERLATLDDPGGGVARFDGEPPIAGRFAVLPAAFNPPTRAHLRLLERAAALPGVAGAAALLSTNNVDKGRHGATLAERVAMLLAARDDALTRFAVLATPAARFVDQAAALRRAFPAVAFDFVAGHDTLVRIFEPRYYPEGMDAALRELFAAHRLIATNRGEVALHEVERFLDQSHVRAFRDAVVLLELDADAAGLSSTNARGEAARGAEPADAPPAVRRFIAEHRLYRE